jgi:hypothetical protein
MTFGNKMPDIGMVSMLDAETGKRQSQRFNSSIQLRTNYFKETFSKSGPGW